MQRIKLNWTQSTFVKNTPLYYVEHKNQGIVSIELMYNGKEFTKRWAIRIFNQVVEIMDGTFGDEDKVKLRAEQLLKERIKEISKLF